jgi:hypothetical protein
MGMFSPPFFIGLGRAVDCGCGAPRMAPTFLFVFRRALLRNLAVDFRK